MNIQTNYTSPPHLYFVMNHAVSLILLIVNFSIPFDLLYHLSVLFRLIVTFGTLHYPSIWYKMYIMAVPSGAGTTYRFAVPELIPGFKWVSC